MKWVGVFALAACANAPDTPDFFDDGPLVVSNTANGIAVEHPVFTLRFAQPNTIDPAIPLPESIVMGQREVLGFNDQCNLESGVGTALFPGLAVTADRGHFGP